MIWSCAAIDHGVTIYENGKIAPCCQIVHTYRKDISEISNDPFADLRTNDAPAACKICIDAEKNNLLSPRQQFNARKTSAKGIQFADIRNTNLCNIKCRTCYPGNSSQWAMELGHTIPIQSYSITNYKDLIITPSLNWVYYTGGEPFINVEHWELLEELVSLGYSKNITLAYNSNITTLKFKNKDILGLWKNFKRVSVMASIDAIGEKFDYVRSGADWNTVDQNIKLLQQFQQIDLSITCTVSILNIWFIAELLEYFKGFKVTLTDLHYPDYLSLSAIPDSLKSQALSCVDDIEKLYADKNKINHIRSMINNNSNQQFFKDTLLHTLVLDKIRNEKLFELLPFKQEAITQAFKNL
jgi:sulfatase maturation enzyme AslB (radical SAM superfamily)